MKNKNMEENKGITLIALIITIIVMLILVAVAVNTAVNSGLFGHAQNATGQWAESQRSESEIGNDNYVDDTVGKYTPVDMKKTLENFTKNPDDYKHPDQSNTNGDRAIGTDGKSVNMDLWKYEIIDEDNRYLRLGGGTITYGGSPSYANENIIDGKIQGTVPQYVHIDGKDGIFTVTDMFFAFVRCSNLVIAPEIPNTVTNMLGTFSNCKSLEKAPEIPETVMSMRYTFMYCTSLTEIQDLPNSVSNMEETFKGCENLTKIGKLPENITSLDDTFFGCTSLKTAPTLPKKLESLRRTFGGCTNLKEAPEIPDSVSSLGFTFGNCSSLEKAPKIPVGVTNMNQTFYNCSSLEKAPEIPSGVTSMSETFCGCARIQKAPEIPETVKGQMSLTFSGCTSLTGNIKIKSTEISNIWRFFYETTNDLTVQVPANSTTYTTFINEYGSSSNITIETF